MTRPLGHVKERIVLALLKSKLVFSSQRAIAEAAGLLDGSEPRGGAKLRCAQRNVRRLVRLGLIRQSVSPEKVDNSYTLSMAGRAYAAARYPEQASPTRRPDKQPHAGAPR